MSKRFTDTEKWKQKSFRELEPEMKLFWFYINDNCDHAGIWQVDFDTASFMIGQEIKMEMVLQRFPGNIYPINDCYWFLLAFPQSQYGDIDTKTPPIKSAHNRLTQHGVLELARSHCGQVPIDIGDSTGFPEDFISASQELPKGYRSPKDKEQEKAMNQKEEQDVPVDKAEIKAKKKEMKCDRVNPFEAWRNDFLKGVE